MITQQELTDKCTPEIIKKMCELAEGFEYKSDEFANETFFVTYKFDICWDRLYKHNSFFPLLIHRAVEGWNKEHINDDWSINISCEDVLIHYWNCGEQELRLLKQFTDYQPTTLTHAECAMFDCLLEVLK